MNTPSKEAIAHSLAVALGIDTTSHNLALIQSAIDEATEPLMGLLQWVYDEHMHFGWGYEELHDAIVAKLGDKLKPQNVIEPESRAAQPQEWTEIVNALAKCLMAMDTPELRHARMSKSYVDAWKRGKAVLSAHNAAERESEMKIVPIKGRDCYSHAQAMAKANPGLLTYVEGQYRAAGSDADSGWTGHAWCETKGGQIVDIYGILYLPQFKLEYQGKRD